MPFPSPTIGDAKRSADASATDIINCVHEDARRAAASPLVKRRGQMAAGAATEWRPARYLGRGTRTRRRRALPAAPPWRRRHQFPSSLERGAPRAWAGAACGPCSRHRRSGVSVGIRGRELVLPCLSQAPFPLACEPSKARSRVSCKLDPEITRVSWDRGVYRTKGHPQVIARSLAVSPKQSRRCS
ncbi:hypothetical protein V1280_004782 [Bradyrhizobium sp. AZCC 2230]